MYTTIDCLIGLRQQVHDHLFRSEKKNKNKKKPYIMYPLSLPFFSKILTMLNRMSNQDVLYLLQAI